MMVALEVASMMAVLEVASWSVAYSMPVTAAAPVVVRLTAVAILRSRRRWRRPRWRTAMRTPTRVAGT